MPLLGLGLIGESGNKRLGYPGSLHPEGKYAKLRTDAGYEGTWLQRQLTVN